MEQAFHLAGHLRQVQPPPQPPLALVLLLKGLDTAQAILVIH